MIDGVCIWMVDGVTIWMVAGSTPLAEVLLGRHLSKKAAATGWSSCSCNNIINRAHVSCIWTVAGSIRLFDDWPRWEAVPVAPCRRRQRAT